MNTINTVLKLIKQFWYVIVLVLILVLGIFVKNWYNGKIEDSYNQGVSVTEVKWKKAQEEKDRLTAQFKNEQQARVDALSEELAKARQDLQNQKINGGEKQVIYVKSPAGQAKGIDDDFVEIYNDSLGRTR